MNLKLLTALVQTGLMQTGLAQAGSRQRNWRSGWRPALTATLLVSMSSVPAQTPRSSAITPNYKDADIAQITEAVAAVTGKTIILDPRVKAQVTMLSSTPMSPNAFYEAYLSILQVYGFTAVSQGNLIKILPDANARTMPGTDVLGNSNVSDAMVTQVVTVKYLNAATLVAVLRPLMATYGNLAAVGSQQLVMTDRAANVSRMMTILQRLDQPPSDDGYDIVQLKNATAADTIKVLNNLNAATGAASAQTAETTQLKIVADDRTNSIIITGDKSARLKMKTMVAYLDTPLETNGNVKVRYLRYADAETLAKSLKEQLQGITQVTNATATPGGGNAAPVTTSTTNSANNGTSIGADKNTNALIIAATPKMMQQIDAIVDKLDIRRAQVHVEAIVVEVNDSKSAELGVNWALYGSDGSNVPAAVFSGGASGSTITDIASAISSGSYTSIPAGTTLGVGRILDSGLSFAAILRLLRSDTSNNIISTPSIVTLDNEEATIEVAKEVPFVTGQYTSNSTGSSSSSSVNPFQTISRQSVGTKLKITPQVSEGGSVILKITQEASSLDTSSTVSAVDLVTNKRTITTAVAIEDGGMIVLGGLLDNNLSETNARVPILGSIPLIGNLFKARTSSKSKRNLMVFIHPTVILNESDAMMQTNAKYNFMRNLQQNTNKGKASLLPGEKQPTLPELPAEMQTPAANEALQKVQQQQQNTSSVETSPAP